MDFKIQNIVGSIDVGFCLRLECFHTCHSQFCSYEPELFPGLIYRLHEPKVVLLIFVSGKVVITGAKLRTEINDAFEKIYPILKNFKKFQRQFFFINHVCFNKRDALALFGNLGEKNVDISFFFLVFKQTKNIYFVAISFSCFV